MTKLAILKASAEDVAKIRGHRLTRWKSVGNGGAKSKCKDCWRWVQVLEEPRPNQVEIGGPALAVNCDRRR